MSKILKTLNRGRFHMNTGKTLFWECAGIISVIGGSLVATFGFNALYPTVWWLVIGGVGVVAGLVTIFVRTTPKEI